jgi:phage tail sheath protein FI
MHVRFTLALGQNVLATGGDGSPAVRGLSDDDVVLVTQGGSPPTTTQARATSYLDTVTGTHTWKFAPATGTAIELADLNPALDTVEVVTVTVAVAANEPGALPAVWAGLPLDPRHRLAGAPDSLAATFDADDPSARGTPITIDLGTNASGLAVLDVFASVQSHLHDEDPTQRSVDVVLTGGSDGDRPDAADYEGEAEPDDSKLGLVAFEDIEDISIVAAPGSTFDYAHLQADANQVINSLIIHAQRMRYRIAVIDCGNNQPLSAVREMRAKFDSSYAAFYYPWVTILDPVTGQEAAMPPSGFVAGIYARNDVQRAVYKAPANEVVNLAIGFERLLNQGQQEVLNPEGINCFRYFPGRGYRLWGARTMSSDPEWKYVNLRRYFAFLEHSIDRGTQWAVFEPNGEALWANVRGTVDDFLFDQWQRGAMLGEKAEKAYFVRCDRSTMTQNDLDNGRLVCLIGVAALRPAEFVIFRIGQWTADRKV